MILDFFPRTQSATDRVRSHVSARAGESSMRSLMLSALRHLDFVHNLALVALNNTMKKYPFVDPLPLDELLAEMVDAFLDWLELVTGPDWLVDVLNHIGRLDIKARAAVSMSSEVEEIAFRRAIRSEAPVAVGIGATRAETAQAQAQADLLAAAAESDDVELEHFGRFLYPIPLKVRELQDLVRPFMEVRSAHYISNLDAIVQELIRGLLRLFYGVRAWDDALVECIETVADASTSDDQRLRMAALLELTATMEMDPFELTHTLMRVNGTLFLVTPGEIEMLAQQLALLGDKRLISGHPTISLEHGGLSTMSHLGMGGQGGDAFMEGGGLIPARKEAAKWWRHQGFSYAAPTNLLANAILTSLVDAGLHPDSWVAEWLPRVLVGILGVQTSYKAFMCRLLPKVGGFVEASGVEVPVGTGLTLLSNPARAAEALLVFLRQYSDIFEEGRGTRASAARSSGGSKRSTRASLWRADLFLQDMNSTGHAVEDVHNLLEGATEIPEHVLKVPLAAERYRITDEQRRQWEVSTKQDLDVLETLQHNHRDLGPYIHLDLDDKQALKKLWGNVDPTVVNCITHPEVQDAALESLRRLGTHGLPVEESDSEYDSDPDPNVRSERNRLPPGVSISDAFGLKLVDYQGREQAGGSSSSTFVNFFKEEGRQISRSCLQGLPKLPWCFGSDPRNAIIMDFAESGVAPFHCIFSSATAQRYRACVIPLGDALSKSYVVCPKYQPLQIMNGDRLVCHQWTFEMRIRPVGPHTSRLTILTDEGTTFEVPEEGCHLGAGSSSRQLAYQPGYPKAKFALNHRLKGLASVHVAFLYQAPMNRWTLVDHSPDEHGCLLMLKTGVAYPLSEGLRIKMGPATMEVVINRDEI